METGPTAETLQTPSRYSLTQSSVAGAVARLRGPRGAGRPLPVLAKVRGGSWRPGEHKQTQGRGSGGWNI